ncbi:hypothetical protein VHEMI04553 [[Torrubiella] hemipterigena]|uniref:Major facilitator superfamily (MFS) profile domain-containing protein n=1 Tax=[Torrubiella] hemipterigena TaxID=1531966 RepID=A0A0A1TEA7_9HYPO|nr:hypothetical protein VHEMI04553 [[Torrubiella] hemipterigena]
MPSIRSLIAEFGITSVLASPRDAHLVILMRTTRMMAFGAVSLIFALFLSAIGFSDLAIGVFMTATLAGDVIVSLVVSLLADALGRRRVLFAGAALMAASGFAFIVFENYWILLLAAVLGVVSATGGDFGPFRSVEESTLAHLTTATTRPDVMSWYVTMSSLGSAMGTEISGKVIKALKARSDGKDGKANTTRVYHAMFWVYVVAGAVSMAAASLMTAKSEADASTVKTPQRDDEAAEGLLEVDEERVADTATRKEKESLWTRLTPQNVLRVVSPESRGVVIKLWLLLTIDSLADGMVSYGLTNYYLARKFDLSESFLGDVMSICYLLAAVSTIFASPLSRRLGLVNTMVFTHIPSSAAVLFFPLPHSLALTMVLLFIRTGLNNMDQGPRAALISAVVKPGERTAVMGITATLRTLASTLGPSLTGFLANSNRFWIAYVLAGALRLGYDFGLWYLFTGIKTDTDENADEDEQ